MSKLQKKKKTLLQQSNKRNRKSPFSIIAHVKEMRLNKYKAAKKYYLSVFSEDDRKDVSKIMFGKDKPFDKALKIAAGLIKTK